MKRLNLILTVIVVIMIGAISAVFTACSSGEQTGTGETEAADPGANSESALLVSVKKMAYEPFSHFFEVNGMVEAVNDAFISPELNGRIKRIHVKEGQRVKIGQLLVSLNSEVTESSIAEARASLELARTVYTKRKGLWDKKIGSEVQFLQAKTDKESLENRLKALEAQLRMAKIKAPIDGIVDKIFLKEGELAVPGLQLIQLVNLKEVYVTAEVSESYIANVAKNDPVNVRFPSYSQLNREAPVYRTGNVVNYTNRTFLVQVMLDNDEEKLKPNMMATLRIRDYSAEAALVVPSIIIKNDMNGAYLYVVEKEEGKSVARKIYVESGRTESGNTMILKGLKPGQKVIVDGYNLAKNGMPVKIGE